MQGPVPGGAAGAAGRSSPTLFAVPGNHDWYDGLTAFLRLFVRSRDRQLRRLAHRAVPVVLRGGAAGRLVAARRRRPVRRRTWTTRSSPTSTRWPGSSARRPGDPARRRRRPGSRPPTTPTAYDTIDYFIRTIIDPTGAQVRLLLSGDLHHYARYTGPDRQLITCGGGGAYLYPTHKLPERIEVPPRDTLARKASSAQPYDLVARYPDAGALPPLRLGLFARLPFRNPGFTTLLGTLHTLLMLAMAGATANWADSTDQRLFSVPLVVMLLVTLLGGGRSSPSRRARAASGTPGTGSSAWPRRWRRSRWPSAGTWVWLAAAVLRLAVAAAGGRRGGALRPGDRSGRQPAGGAVPAGRGPVRGERQRAVRRPGHRGLQGFLRLRIDPDGTLTIYPIGVDRVCQRLAGRTRTQPPHAPWLSPASPRPPDRATALRRSHAASDRLTPTTP